MSCQLLLLAFLFLELFANIHASPTLVSADDVNQNLNNGILVFASVIFRHGDRNIAKSFPKDPYKDEIHWPGGIGQLTQEGKRQQYRLGQYFRRRYGRLLGDGYSPNKVYIQSTDTDRTLMSAEANMAGLFPPTANETWDEKINWQPIPVHTIPQSLDHVLYATKDCPKYKTIYEQYLEQSPEVRRIYTKHAELFQFLTKKSGANITTITDVYWLYNTLHIERDQNKSLARWVKEVIKPNGPMEYIATFDFKTYTDTPQLARLKSGFLLKEILEHFSQKANSTLEPNRLLWIYSAHDITITNMLNSLGLYKLHIPSYASSLHFELYKSGQNEHYIKIFYRNFGEEKPTPMLIPGCGRRCPMEQFYSIYHDIIPGDFDTECRLS